MEGEGRLGRNIQPISHLFFADDVLIFSNGKSRSLINMRTLLQQYEKLCVFVSKQIRGRQLVQIQQVLGCSIKNLPFTYLGAPLHKGRSKSEYFERLLQTITNKLEGWKAKFMSLAGKITLIYQELDKWKPGLTEEQWQTATLVVLDENTRDELWCSLTPYIKKYRTPPSEEGMDGNGVEYNVFKGGESLLALDVFVAAIPRSKPLTTIEMEMCIRNGITRVEIEMDAAMVVNMISDTFTMHWRYVYKIRRVRALISHFESINLIFREQNMAADNLARRAIGEVEKKEYVHLQEVPREVQRLIFLDRIGFPNFRSPCT